MSVANRLLNKTAVITGAAGAIGAAAAKHFASEGANLLLSDRDATALAKVEAEIEGAPVETFVADVTSLADNVAMFKAAEARFGGVDIFLANAGIEGEFANIADADPDVFDSVMAINVKGVFLGLKVAMPALARRGGGSIVISSSGAGVRGTAGMGTYSASKQAVVGLMRSAALEGAPDGIRVNTIHPSPVDSPMMTRVEQNAAPDDPDSVKNWATANLPFGRYGTVDEIARVMVFLASDDASWVSGTTQMIDGAESV